MPEKPEPGTGRNCSIDGSMDEEQQHLVRASFANVAPIADTAAAMFYDRLFATDPTLRPPLGEALRALRTVRRGGYLWKVPEVEERLRVLGYEEVETFAHGSVSALLLVGHKPV